MRFRALALAFLASLPLATSCGDDPTGPGLATTFSGTIEVRNGTTIPANARVLVLWGISATSPDYSYVYGSGTVTPNGAVTITFNSAPPTEALNLAQAGVGLVIITTDQTLAQGRVPDGYTLTGLLGYSENHSIIFTQNLSSALSAGWYGRFNGFGLGEVERNTTTFDSFKLVASTSLKIIVDDLAKLRGPNWT